MDQIRPEFRDDFGDYGGEISYSGGSEQTQRLEKPQDSETAAFSPEKNIENIKKVASEVYVHGKFPPKTEINGMKAEPVGDLGHFTTLNAQTGQVEYVYLPVPEQLQEIWSRDWYTMEENSKTVILTLSEVEDNENNQYQRIQLFGVEQPNAAIGDERMTYQRVNVVFQFDIPSGDRKSFSQLLTKDREKGPQNIQRLLEKLYGGLISIDASNEPDEKSIKIKSIEKVVVIDDTFKMVNSIPTNSNPNRVFPRPEN